MGSRHFKTEDERYKYLLGYLYGLQKVYQRDEPLIKVSTLFNIKKNKERGQNLENEIFFTRKLLVKYFNKIYGTQHDTF
jgi:hypothetical protein